MSNTTEYHKETAREIAKKISEVTKHECTVDDWGRFGNFSLIVYFDKGDRHTNLRPITAGIRKVLKEFKDKGATLRGMEVPKRMYDTYTYRGVSDCTFKGYEQSYIQIDIDFIEYHPDTNTFAVQEQKEFEPQGKLF